VISSAFTRSERVDTGRIEAQLSDSVLWLLVPRAAPAEGRSIQVHLS
jgi:hypothetical protein